MSLNGMNENLGRFLVDATSTYRNVEKCFPSERQLKAVDSSMVSRLKLEKN